MSPVSNEDQFPLVIFRFRAPIREGRREPSECSREHLRNAVTKHNHRGEASSDDCEKEARCYGIFHGNASSKSARFDADK
jgi:hypothetical protein